MQWNWSRAVCYCFVIWRLSGTLGCLCSTMYSTSFLCVRCELSGPHHNNIVCTGSSGIIL